MIYNRIQLVFILFLLIQSGLSLLYALEQAEVLVYPNGTNEYGHYRLEARLDAPDPWIQVQANIDSIILVFPQETILPARIEASLVRINQVGCEAIKISGKRMSILSPVDLRNFLGGSDRFSVEIIAEAGIKNPARSGEYVIGMQLVTADGQPITALISSERYDIIKSSSSISAATVMPNPPLTGQAAALGIRFHTGSAGFLKGGSSRITIRFDDNFQLPNGILAGVSINGTTALTTASHKTVVITTPVDVDNYGEVVIHFSHGSGIKNPVQPVESHLQIKTSSENRWIMSSLFTIGAADIITVASVTPSPATVNVNAGYDIEIIRASDTQTISGVDTLSLIFDNNTRLPDLISDKDIHLLAEGFSVPVSGTGIRKKRPENPDTLQVILPENIARVKKINLLIDQTAGVLNPSENGNYKLSVHSSLLKKTTVSNSYHIHKGQTQVSPALVIPSNPATGEGSAYELQFTLGSQGRLQPGKSKIYLIFESEYELKSSDACLDSVYIAFSDHEFIQVNRDSIKVDEKNRKLTLPVPSGAETANGDPVTLSFRAKRNPLIINPAQPGNYFLSVRTSAEPVAVRSHPISIGGKTVLMHELTLSDSTVNSSSGYALTFQTETSLQSAAADYIELWLPEGTSLPPVISSSKFLINRMEAASLDVFPATRRIKAFIPQFVIAAGELVELTIAPESRILNPAIPGKRSYNLQVSTSKDFVPVSSRNYGLYGKDLSVKNVAVEIDPAITNVSGVRHKIDFITSDSGKLQGSKNGASSFIIVDFDSATIVPNFIPATTVGLNGHTTAAVEVLASGPAGKVRLIVPSGLEVQNNSPVSVIFEAGAALSTSAAAGTYRIGLKTSSDTLFSSAGGAYKLGDTRALFISSLTLNPSNQNDMAAYSLRFSTGSQGVLQPSDLICLVFSPNTFIPPFINRNDISVNGRNPENNPVVRGDSLLIPVPDSIDRMTPVTLLINREAGILNPALSGNYILTVSTSSEPDPQPSPEFHIAPGRSTVSAVSVECEPALIGVEAVYKIDLVTGSQGRLPPGQGTITLGFDPGIILSTDPEAYNKSYIIAAHDTILLPTERLSISGSRLAFSIPENIHIGNQEPVSIILGSRDRAGPIRNPAREGSYVVQVNTSVEIRPITSPVQKISAVPPVSRISVSLSPAVVNAEHSVSLVFEVQREIPAGDGNVSITFPQNTLVPAEIKPEMITFSHGRPDSDYFIAVAGVSTNPATGTVTLTFPEKILRDEKVCIIFSQQAGLENPSTPGSYRLSVRTSTQEIDGLSAPYSLVPGKTSVVNLTVQLDPEYPGRFGRSVWRFTTGRLGRLVSGKSQISLLIPSDSRFVNGLPANSKITVNGVPAHQLQLKKRKGTAPDTLLITVPVNTTIGNAADVSVIIDSTAGLKNTSSAGQRMYSVFTSIEQTPLDIQFRLPVQLASFISESRSGIVFLKWISETALEDGSWMIERKKLSPVDYQSVQDGDRTIDQTGQSFEALAQIPAHSRSEVQQTYVFQDSLVDIGAIYAYRLSDIDQQGIVTYHDIIYQEVLPPSDFVLFRNTPNPFKSHTVIKYSLPSEARVDLKIYSVVGQEIYTLAEVSQTAGLYQVEWSGTNQSGQPVASGMYVVSFRAVAAKGGKDFSKLMKIMLLR